MASMNNKLKKTLAAITAASMLCGMTPVHAEGGAAADSAPADAGGSSLNESLVSGISRSDTYAGYLNSHADAARPKRDIVINAKDYASLSEDGNGVTPETVIQEFQGEQDVLVWSNHGGVINYEFEVSETGLYNLELFYYTVSGENTVIEMAMQLDGEYPFSAAKTFTLDRYWKQI